MGSRVAILAAALVGLTSAGCASTLHADARGLRGRAHGLGGEPPSRTPLRGARADFDPVAFEGVFAGAVRAVQARGLEITSCSFERGALTTTTLELDAPCGGTTCLARDSWNVKLGYRRARVIVTREVWDPAVRAWRVLDDSATLGAISETELEVVSQIARAPSAPPAELKGKCAPRWAGLWASYRPPAPAAP